jgi:hypothetical protein
MGLPDRGPGHGLSDFLSDSLGFPHAAVDRSVVVVAFISFVIAAEIDSDEPSAIASRYDLANFASRRNFLLGSQLRHTTDTLIRHRLRIFRLIEYKDE